MIRLCTVPFMLVSLFCTAFAVFKKCFKASLSDIVMNEKCTVTITHVLSTCTLNQPLITPHASVLFSGWTLCLTAEYLCLLPVLDNSSMQRGCPPGPTRGHQSSAHWGQTLWKCLEHCEAPDPRLSHPVVYQISAATQRPVLLLTTFLWTKSELRILFLIF